MHWVQGKPHPCDSVIILCFSKLALKLCLVWNVVWNPSEKTDTCKSNGPWRRKQRGEECHGSAMLEILEGFSLFVSWCTIPPTISNNCQPQDQVEGLGELGYISINFEEDLLQFFLLNLRWMRCTTGTEIPFLQIIRAITTVGQLVSHRITWGHFG